MTRGFGRGLRRQTENLRNERFPRLEVRRPVGDRRVQRVRDRLGVRTAPGYRGRRVRPAQPWRTASTIRRPRRRCATRVCRLRGFAVRRRCATCRYRPARQVERTRRLPERASSTSANNRASSSHPADERQVVNAAWSSICIRSFERVADSKGNDQVALALDPHRWERRGAEARRAFHNRPARDNLSRFSRSHQSRREVHRVTHDGVRTAIVGTDVAREHPAAVDADPHRDRKVGVDDAARGCDHAFFVLAEDGRCTRQRARTCRRRRRHHLRAARHRALHRRVRRSSRVLRGRAPFATGPSGASRASRPSKCTKPTVTVRCSGVPPPAAHCSATAGGRYESSSIDDGKPKSAAAAAGRPGAPAQQEAVAQWLADAFRRETAAVAGLITIWPALDVLHCDELTHRLAGDEQLPARLTDQEAVERSRVDPDRHAQGDVAGGGLQLPDGPQAVRASPPPTRVARRRCSWPAKAEQQRVAAELQEARHRPRRRPSAASKQLPIASVTSSAPTRPRSRQPFRHRGEPGRSANTIVPRNGVQRSSARLTAQSATSRGT